MNWRIIPAIPAHIPPIAANLREADQLEIWASHRRTPHEALHVSLAHAELAWTALVNEIPSIMWGVGRVGTLLAPTGSPWLLATPDIHLVERPFLRLNRVYIARMLELFPRLENHVHAANTASLRWLRWCGFTIETKPVRFNNEPFYRFWKEEPVCAIP